MFYLRPEVVVRCKATWKSEFILPWREAGPPHHHEDEEDSDQWAVNKELSLADHPSYSSRRAPTKDI